MKKIIALLVLGCALLAAGAPVAFACDGSCNAADGGGGGGDQVACASTDC
jgi:hypothetical protein